MFEKPRKSSGHHGPSTRPVDQGLEGAIFDDDDTARSEPEADLRDLDAAARGEPRIVPRSGEGPGPAGER